MPAEVERALYEERTLLRLMGMRRTMFVVDRAVAPVVHAACGLGGRGARAGQGGEDARRGGRRRQEAGGVAGAGRGRGAGGAARARRVRRRPSWPRPTRCWRPRSAPGQRQVERDAEGRVARPVVVGLARAGDPGAAARRLDVDAVPLGGVRRVGRRAAGGRPGRRRARRAGPALAARLRARAAERPAVVDRLVGGADEEGAGRRRRRRRRARGARRLASRRGPPRRRPRARRAAPATLDRPPPRARLNPYGLEAPRLLPRRPRRPPLRHQRQRRRPTIWADGAHHRRLDPPPRRHDRHPPPRGPGARPSPPSPPRPRPSPPASATRPSRPAPAATRRWSAGC